tara:strand:+ start:1802 stop:2572 length:771 start_codon:yes stop_codon:yes gene_type:complete
MDNLQAKYKLLEVDETCSTEDIKRSYKRLCLKYHPDKCNSGDAEKFIEIKRAYEELLRVKEANINFFIIFFNFINTFGKCNDITIRLNIPLEDIYNESVKKITYTRVNHKLFKQTESFYLELIGWREEYILEAKGDFNVITGKYGDLHIVLDIEYGVFSYLELNKIINLYDINTVVEINLYEYYYGVKRMLRYFNNTRIEIDYVPHKMGDTQVLEGYGLTNDENERYHLYIFYKTDLKRCNLFEENEVLIKNCFNI